MTYGIGRWPQFAFLFGSLLCATATQATNGLNFIGAGMESSAMAGADLAVARDPMALNTNPAGLAQLRSLALEQHLVVAHEIDGGFSDSLNPDQGLTNKLAPVSDVAVARPFFDHAVTLGAGLFVQGGSGAAFKNVTTPFGTSDDLSAKFGILKASVGGAARVTDRLSLGGSAALYYARLDQKVFPGTSSLNPADPARPFFGTYFRDASTFAPGVKLGAQYRLTERLNLGAIYGSKVDLPLRGHRFVVDETAIGLGRVVYRHLHIDGLAEPQEAGVGAAYQITDRLLLALDVKWLDWSGAVKRSTSSASNPDNPAAPQTLSASADLNWRDQYVIALGAAYDLTPSTVLWAGYNYGRNPIPSSSASPLLSAFGEHHFTAGVGWRPWEGWVVGTSLEFLVPTEVRSTSPDLPLGSDVRVRTGYLALHAGLRWEW